MSSKVRLSVSISMLALAAAPALADETDYHQTQSSDIIVTAPIQRDRMDVLAGTSVLTGAQLTTALRPTIGETIEHTPGVSATSFGPNASRPILRGLQGERVRMLTDGIGSVDVSNTSVDHAVAINPLLAERIEVLRGPEALLYGSAAIGGVVNVIDKRIPRAIPDEAVHVDAIATYGSAANERSGGVSIDAPIAGGFVAHVDGSYQKTGNLRIGGYALSPEARARALASAQLPGDPDAGEEIDFAANAGVKNKLPNSQSETWVVGGGLSYIDGASHYGIAYTHYDSRYGVPIRFATEPGQEQEAPRIDLVQNRFDARAEIVTGGSVIQTIRARLAYAKYRHFELEEDGSVGTAFYNNGMEGRIELVQADRGIWHGATGAQFFVRDFDVVGDEAFLPRNQTQQIGLFTLQQLDYGIVKVEGGLRYEKSWLSANPFAVQPQFFDGGRTFDTFSGSLGASYRVTDDWRIGVNLSRTQRAPAAEELFANGPHAGTEAFEIGNPDFKAERSWGLEGVLHGKGPGFTIHASIYHNWFDNFIYDSPDGTLEDGLPVFRYAQAKARFYGAELEATADLAQVGSFAIKADALGDFVHAKIITFGPAPRIPPLRLLGGLSAESAKVDGRIEVEWTDKARNLAAFETPTDGFTLVNASLTFRPFDDHPGTSIVLGAHNIFDVNARRHASYLKDFAPLAGRDFRITTRIGF
ncbi:MULTISPECIES: TonB-dependent receptor domain-containing protein [unclassified Sphingomonas]|uniref:TonB-dependent receptor domain-containing protein n=1 Tax=unclassified Sphingomonas TaxID=196159 RepID=UPI0007021E2E|nr:MULTISPECIES: TonB-dependent receptor [unclassified Sphingomonas]KQX18363.1 TonB-dependent receptor [Sphingomonas sp. Root1294]KQY72312.1 TonB-dependent receptor [Sphingomonas sp. Root50]KRB94416.1 TonB-dependent receptor [Sphingomonas sp. Root720]